MKSSAISWDFFVHFFGEIKTLDSASLVIMRSIFLLLKCSLVAQKMHLALRALKPKCGLEFILECDCHAVVRGYRVSI